MQTSDFAALQITEPYGAAEDATNHLLLPQT